MREVRGGVSTELSHIGRPIREPQDAPRGLYARVNVGRCHWSVAVRLCALYGAHSGFEILAADPRGHFHVGVDVGRPIHADGVYLLRSERYVRGIEHDALADPCRDFVPEHLFDTERVRLVADQLHRLADEGKDEFRFLPLLAFENFKECAFDCEGYVLALEQRGLQEAAGERGFVSEFFCHYAISKSSSVSASVDAHGGITRSCSSSCRAGQMPDFSPSSMRFIHSFHAVERDSQTVRKRIGCDVPPEYTRFFSEWRRGGKNISTHAFLNSRGRDSGRPLPPAQIRTSGFPAYGSYLWMNGAKANTRIRMRDANAGNPPAHQTVHALPIDTATLAPTA